MRVTIKEKATQTRRLLREILENPQCVTACRAAGAALRPARNLLSSMFLAEQLASMKASDPGGSWSQGLPSLMPLVPEAEPVFATAAPPVKAQPVLIAEPVAEAASQRDPEEAQPTMIPEAEAVASHPEAEAKATAEAVAISVHGARQASSLLGQFVLKDGLINRCQDDIATLFHAPNIVSQNELKMTRGIYLRSLASYHARLTTPNSNNCSLNGLVRLHEGSHAEQVEALVDWRREAQLLH